MPPYALARGQDSGGSQARVVLPGEAVVPRRGDEVEAAAPRAMGRALKAGQEEAAEQGSPPFSDPLAQAGLVIQQLSLAFVAGDPAGHLVELQPVLVGLVGASCRLPARRRPLAC
jgi:hypothetical protein